MMRKVQHRQNRVVVIGGGIGAGLGDVFALRLDWLADLQTGNFLREPFAVALAYGNEYFGTHQVLRAAFELHDTVDLDDELLMFGGVVKFRAEENLADRTLYASQRRTYRMRVTMMRKNLRCEIAHEVSVKDIGTVYGKTYGAPPDGNGAIPFEQTITCEFIARHSQETRGSA